MATRRPGSSARQLINTNDARAGRRAYLSLPAAPARLAIARLVVVAEQRASSALAAATDMATLDRSINNRLLDLLP